MTLRSVVRISLVLIVVGVHFFSPMVSPATAQTTPRKQERLAKSSLLKASLRAAESQQDASGGFSNLNSSVDPRMTADVVNMLIALRNEGIEVQLDAALAYLQQTDPVKWVEAEFVTLTDGEVARIVMALVAAGGDPRNVGGNDLVAMLTASWHADTGIYGAILLDSSLVVMALVAAGEPIEDKAIETFETTQLDDGSWDFYGTAGPGEVLATAFMIQTLVALERGDDLMVDNAVAFLRTRRNDDGAFGSSVGADPDSYLTGVAISALIAAGEDLKSPEWSDTVSALLTFQKENGFFQRFPLAPEDDLSSTAFAVIALAGAYWPVVPVE